MTCYPALITPFDKDGLLDLEGFAFHIRRQEEAGADGLVVLGTSGESSTLSQEEKERLMRFARAQTTLPLMMGCGYPSTVQTIENVHRAAAWGADSVLVVSPFYNKPTQEGLFRHYEAVAKASVLPIMVYNNPTRTGINIEVETLRKIAELPRICGVKESSGNLAQITQVLSTLKKEHPDFSVICGDDHLTFCIMALGGDGVISGGANLFPDQMVELIQLCKSGAFVKARELHFALLPLFQALTVESHPIPLKAALQLMDLPSGDPRLPLTPLNTKYIPTLTQALHGQKEFQLSKTF